jgi:hypothetical protein
METKDEENVENDPFSAYGTYSYADYLTWDIDYMVELIKGKVFKQAAAPKRIHQEIALKIAVNPTEFLKGKKRKANIAPFDVRLPVSPKRTRTSSPWYSRISVWSATLPSWMKWAVSGHPI